jgi:F-type H+-transporting ATPase subunit b
MEGFGGIGINWQWLLAFVINFVILLALLGIFLYKPVLKMVDERSNRIKESMEQAEATREEYARAQEEVQKQINRAREEGQALIAQATQIGERVREEAGEKAVQEAQALVDRTRVELERERDKAIDDLRREFADISIMAAEKVINERLDKEKHRRIIEQTLDESPTLRKN